MRRWRSLRRILSIRCKRLSIAWRLRSGLMGMGGRREWERIVWMRIMRRRRGRMVRGVGRGSRKGKARVRISRFRLMLLVR